MKNKKTRLDQFNCDLRDCELLTRDKMTQMTFFFGFRFYAIYVSHSPVKLLNVAYYILLHF